MDIASYQLYLGYFATNCSFSYRYQQIIQYQPLYPWGTASSYGRKRRWTLTPLVTPPQTAWHNWGHYAITHTVAMDDDRGTKKRLYSQTGRTPLKPKPKRIALRFLQAS